MKIGEVAQRAGLRASAVRYYESIGLLPKPQRIAGQRRYEAEVLAQLAVINVAKHAGFRIEEIKQLLHGWPQHVPASRRWKLLGQRKVREMEERIASARRIMDLLLNVDRCECLNLEDCGRALMHHDHAAKRGAKWRG